MNKHFSIRLLPAEDGDCLHLEYGQEDDHHQVLIDGGRLSTYNWIREMHMDRVALMVLTHIDADHLEGAIRLLCDEPPSIRFDEIWFNGYRHVSQFDNDPDYVPRTAGDENLRSPQHGEFISALIQKRFQIDQWNTSWKGGAVVIDRSEKLPNVRLPGEMLVTLLSPTPKKLADLAKLWRRKLGAKADKLANALDTLATLSRYKFQTSLDDVDLRNELSIEESGDDKSRGNVEQDTSVANGSSIAFLAEFGEKSALLLGDAHTDVIRSSIAHLLAERELDRLSTNALKLSHHGSSANVTEELLALIDAEHILVSTSGAIHGHPDIEALRMVAESGRRSMTFHFNYASGCPADVANVILRHGHRVCVAQENLGSLVTL